MECAEYPPRQDPPRPGFAGFALANETHRGAHEEREAFEKSR